MEACRKHSSKHSNLKKRWYMTKKKKKAACLQSVHIIKDHLISKQDCTRKHLRYSRNAWGKRTIVEMGFKKSRYVKYWTSHMKSKTTWFNCIIFLQLSGLSWCLVSNGYWVEMQGFNGWWPESYKFLLNQKWDLVSVREYTTPKCYHV